MGRSYSNPASLSRCVEKVRRKSTEDNEYDEYKAVKHEREKKMLRRRIMLEIPLKRTFSNPLPLSLPPCPAAADSPRRALSPSRVAMIERARELDDLFQ